MRKGRLEGKVAIIAGGATGIGASTCHLFAKENPAGIIIADINEKESLALIQEIKGMGVKAEYMYCDVSNEEDWIATVKESVSLFGSIHVLVNSFGIGGPLVRPIVTETSLDAWEKTFKINSTGVFLGMKHVIPIMQKNNTGSIVNVSSVFGLVGTNKTTSYSASKGACRALSRTTAVQYASFNIRVNTVFPGFTETPMTKDIHADPEIRNERLSKTPLNRFAQPHEIAAGILFLASEESSFITGSELVIDGGMTAC